MMFVCDKCGQRYIHWLGAEIGAKCADMRMSPQTDQCDGVLQGADEAIRNVVTGVVMEWRWNRSQVVRLGGPQNESLWRALDKLAALVEVDG